MKIFSSSAIVNGASVRGGSHKVLKTPNQDSYLIRRRKNGICLVVCDGVGSNKYSKEGSMAASKAVFKVFNEYDKKIVDKDKVGEKIEYYYKRFVKKRHRYSAATTCLFVYIYNDSNILIGQAGDGVILIKKDSKFIVYQNKNDDFMNEVVALSCKSNCRSWKIRNLKFDANDNNSLCFLLSTDGISEDILPDKKEDFLNYFIKLSKKDFDKSLYNKLKNWDVPGSLDDKTVITFVWRKKNENT